MAKVKVFSEQVSYGELELPEENHDLESIPTLEKIMALLKLKSEAFEGLYLKNNQIFLFEKPIEIKLVV